MAKGSSNSEVIYGLEVRVFKLEMRYRCIMKFVHVDGTIMILQGMDGLYRGDMVEGVLKG